MTTVTEHLRRHCLASAGYAPARLPDLEELRLTEWCPEFEWLMRSRLIMGVLRGYRRLGAYGKPQWDRLGRIRHELEHYEEDHNTERLVEVATHALLEFVEGNHPGRHYAATDSGGAWLARGNRTQEVCNGE